MAYKFNVGAVILSGSITGSTSITANAKFYGDGSKLQNVTGSGSPAGSDTYIQFNNNGSFGGVSSLYTDGTGSLVAASIDTGTGNITTGGRIALDVDGADGDGNAGAGALMLGATSGDSALYFDGSNLIVSSSTGIKLGTGLPGSNAVLIDSDGLDLPSGDAFLINNTSVLNATTLGSAVAASSLTSVGTLTGLTVDGNVTLGQGGDTIKVGIGADAVYIGTSSAGNCSVTIGHSQAGSVTFEGMPFFEAGQILTSQTVTATTNTIQPGAMIILASGSAAMNVQLPVISAVVGGYGNKSYPVYVKRATGVGGDGSARPMEYTVTVSCSAADTIDGSDEILLESENASVLLVGTGSVWNVF
jgi:hypothetical protein